MIDSGSPPDVVLDLSNGGDSSEVAKFLSLNLGLPTVTSTMGLAEEIKEWSTLTAEQEKYLVQVKPPADIFPDIINGRERTVVALPKDISKDRGIG